LHTDDALVSAQGFVDNESTLRSISWALYTVDTYGVTASTSMLESEYPTDNSRRAEQAGTVDTVFDAVLPGLIPGERYKVKFTGKNGADLTTDIWSNIFSYDDSTPDVTRGLATLCPPTSALRLDLRGHFECGSWPASTNNDPDRHQASTSLLKVCLPALTHALALSARSRPNLRTFRARIQSSRLITVTALLTCRVRRCGGRGLSTPRAKSSGASCA
jgi:hypothetical protein